jgi:antitoxin CcdA
MRILLLGSGGDSLNAATRKAVNLSMDRTLLEEAKALEVNVSRAAELGLKAAVKKAKEEQWLAENMAAIEGYNQYIEENGLPLEKYRQF